MKRKKDAETDIKQELTVQESEDMAEVKQEPAIPNFTKKRSFSTALKEPKVESEEELEETEDKEEDEGPDIDLPDPDTLFVLEEEDGVAYRTRKRHKIQAEDIKCSAEYGIPI
ncbi:hypothetical protein BDV12DRAFT_204892 [Aspergillus spectabilis]